MSIFATSLIVNVKNENFMKLVFCSGWEMSTKK